VVNDRAPLLTTAIDDDLARERRSLLLRRTFLCLIALFVLLGATGVFGVRSKTVTSAPGHDFRLSVRYPSVTRAGLPAAITVRVTHDGGFDGPVNLAITRSYLGLFDEQGVRPEPDASTSEGPFLVWEFEPPDSGDTFTVTIDVIVETGRHFGNDAVVQLRNQDGDTLSSVPLDTWIAP
jgi:hypothetical protein